MVSPLGSGVKRYTMSLSSKGRCRLINRHRPFLYHELSDPWYNLIGGSDETVHQLQNPEG